MVYYIPEPRTVYCIPMARVRAKLAAWLAAYPTRDVANAGYVTTGVLVPLDEFERIAKWVL